MAALMAGGGLAFGTEMLDQSVRRKSDLFSIIDSHLVVSIPYITTAAEVRWKKTKLIVVSLTIAAVIVAAIVAILFILPPLDILFDKAMKALIR
jgi:capsular polysaccharide biosynthesis protein